MSEAAWNVLVFLNAKNNLEKYSFPNFKQMASIGSTTDVNILVEYGRPKARPGGENAGYSSEFGAWSRTLRFRVDKGMKPVESSALMDLGSTNMGDAKSLASFVKWARDTYPAKHTLLIIWDHGQGWRIDVEGAERPQAAAPITGGHRYVSNDDDTGDKLYNRAIQDELTKLLGGERLDVVAFDACLMAMLETAYALRGVARVMVGSEELEPGTGWNYERWLKPLVDKKGDLSPEELGTLMVKGMEDEYGNTDDTTLSATALDDVAAVATSVSAFAESAIKHLTPATVATFKAARAACENYAPGYGLHSIDLGRYMDQITSAVVLDAEVRTAANAVRNQLGRAVRANYASTKRQGNYGSNGLAIYYPTSASAYARDPDREGYAANNTEFPVEFVQKEQWAAFLRHYCKLVP